MQEDEGNWDQDEFDPDGGEPTISPEITPPRLTAKDVRIYALEKALWLKSVTHNTDTSPMTGTQAMSLAEQIMFFIETGTAIRPQDPAIIIDGTVLAPTPKN